MLPACRIVAEAAEGSEANAKIKELAKKVLQPFRH